MLNNCNFFKNQCIFLHFWRSRKPIINICNTDYSHLPGRTVFVSSNYHLDDWVQIHYVIILNGVSWGLFDIQNMQLFWWNSLNDWCFMESSNVIVYIKRLVLESSWSTTKHASVGLCAPKAVAKGVWPILTWDLLGPNYLHEWTTVADRAIICTRGPF